LGCVGEKKKGRMEGQVSVSALVVYYPNIPVRREGRHGGKGFLGGGEKEQETGDNPPLPSFAS
jgi:hypothetical protein